MQIQLVNSEVELDAVAEVVSYTSVEMNLKKLYIKIEIIHKGILSVI